MLSYIKRHSVIVSFIAIIVVVIFVIAGRVAARKGKSAVDTTAVRQVSLVDASTFRKDAATVSAQGQVESIAQVDLKSQVSAPIAYTNYAIGDTVTAGSVILELKNADIRARLDQAKAALTLAEGQYDTSGVSLESSRTSAIDKVRDAYNAVDQTIHGQLDQFLFNSTGGEQPLSSRISDLKLLDKIHDERTDIDTDFTTWKPMVDALSASSTDDNRFQALAEAKTVLGHAAALFQDVSAALNSISANTSSSDATVISGWKTVVSAALSTISGSASSITSADTTLRNALSSKGTSAQANIASAAAGVKSLEAELAKTIITSPITGKIAALPLRVGELASPGMLLASVVGGGGLEVKAFASQEDIDRIVKGAKATIKGDITGVVTNVAPSVNETNKKVEVTIAVKDTDKSKLVVGENVSVLIAAAKAPTTNTATNSYYLPIQDVKIVPGDAFVYTVDENSKLIEHSVKLGQVQGDFVEVTDGITDDMKLATPVYELEPDQSVDVASSTTE